MYYAANWQIAYTKIGVPKKCYILRYLSYLNPFLPNPEVIFPFSLFPGRSVLCCQKQNKVRKEQNIIPFTKMTKSALEKNDKIPSREPLKGYCDDCCCFCCFNSWRFFIHCFFHSLQTFGFPRIFGWKFVLLQALQFWGDNFCSQNFFHLTAVMWLRWEHETLINDASQWLFS